MRRYEELSNRIIDVHYSESHFPGSPLLGDKPLPSNESTEKHTNEGQNVPRRSARLQFPGVSPPPPPLPTCRSTGRKRKPPFPLMNLPRELRDLVYSKAAESSWKLFKHLLCASKQINEEARPVGSENEEGMGLQELGV